MEQKKKDVKFLTAVVEDPEKVGFKFVDDGIDVHFEGVSLNGNNLTEAQAVACVAASIHAVFLGYDDEVRQKIAGMLLQTVNDMKEMNF